MKLLEKLTGHPRYHPEDCELDGKLHWSNKIWVSNIFRLYEWLFGRGVGIRAELTSWPEIVMGVNGAEVVTRYKFHSWEARIVHIEVVLREYLTFISSLWFNPNINYQLGAIALDVATQGARTSTSPLTWSHTCTGSNLILWGGFYATQGSGTINNMGTPTYNSVSMTIADSQRHHDVSNTEGLWWLTGPATGANTISISFSGSSPACNGGAVSYSGASQSGQPDATNGATGNSTTPSTSVTTIADNCWVIGNMSSANSVFTITAGLTSREAYQVDAAGRKGYIEDTNGVKSPAGAQTVNWTIATSGATWAISAASFAPAGASAPVVITPLGSAPQPSILSDVKMF